MGDISKLNQMAVNRMACEMLRSVGREPDPNRLHCLDLLLWHVEGVDGEVETAVAETIRAMVSWLPQRIMNFLELLPGQEYEPAGWAEARTAIELASVVLNDIEQRMFGNFPWYGSLE